MTSYSLPNREGYLIPVTEEDHIRYCVQAILLSEQERLSNGDTFGSNVRHFLFRPLTSTLQREVGTHLLDTLTAQETRIEVLNLQVAPDPLERSKLVITLQYVIKQSQKQQHLKVSLTGEGNAYAQY